MTKIILDEFFQPANLLSLSRVPLGIAVYFLLGATEAQGSIWAVALLIVAGVTDFLDGYVARISLASGASPSAVGEALDPIADKIFAALVIIGLIQFRSFPLWLAGVIIGRDLLILAAGILIARRRSIVVRSSLPGKYYFASLAILLASFVIRFESGITLFTYVTLALWLWSLISYATVFRQHSAVKSSSEIEDADQGSRSGALYRIAATLILSLLTLYYFWRENPLAW
ncbi:MAG: CDP-alcohol phosphatidyltransferase family protein [candidate division Zixibacteria bacterium]|nr:CDP-alcohol phosphatidyltransferase family protein [candidate division Zixibacteria bacterium]